MEHDVFISYSHKDTNIADAICNRLESNGIRCWYAPRNIQPGHEWAEDILLALGESKVMVLVFTDSSNNSTQVKREVSAAISNGVTIIPFKCTISQPTGSMQYYLSTLHWMDAMTDSLEASIAKLSDECHRILDINIQTISKPTQEPTPSKEESNVYSTYIQPQENKNKLPNLAIIVAVVAVVIVILCIVLAPKKDSSDIEIVGNTTTATPTEETTTEAKTEPTQEEPAVVVADGEYYDDPNNDSPDVENYLYEVSYLYTDIYEKGVCLQKYFGDATDVLVIPEVIDGWPVTEIGEKCFEDMDTITKVVLPETVEYIQYRAFYGCSSLVDINLPDGLTGTGGWVFAHCGIKEFIAPKSFNSLGYGTFYSCNNLKNIVLTPEVDSLGSDTFAYLAKGCTITIPNKDVEVNIKAFREDEKITIIAPDESYLKTYAKAMNIAFQSLK